MSSIDYLDIGICCMNYCRAQRTMNYNRCHKNVTRQTKQV